MRVEMSELNQLLEAIKEKNLSIPEVISLIQNRKTEAHPQPQPQPAEDISLTVDYGQTLKQMIDAGKYDWAQREVTEKFFPLRVELFLGEKIAVSTNEKITVSTKLFYFNHSISSEDVIIEMGKSGYRPATLPELLALGIKYPDLQYRFPIIALGSVWHRDIGGRRIPVLTVDVCDSAKRELILGLFESEWKSGVRFLGTRE